MAFWFMQPAWLPQDFTFEVPTHMLRHSIIWAIEPRKDESVIKAAHGFLIFAHRPTYDPPPRQGHLAAYR